MCVGNLKFQNPLKKRGKKKIRLDKKGLERIPSVGGENDIVSAFSITPGVITTGDQGGQIYVRGGTPIQNMILRGFKKTKICALKMSEKIDQGPIYLKKTHEKVGQANENNFQKKSKKFVKISQKV